MRYYFDFEIMLADPKPPLAGTILEDLPFLLARAVVNFRRFNDRTLRAVGLKSQAPGIASVLHALNEQDDCTVNSLVARTHLPNGTLTGLLDGLERDRCIRRVTNADDGRSWRIRLTDKGRRLCVRLDQRHRMVMDLFREALSDDEAAELKRLLSQVTVHMRAYPPEGSVARPRRAAGSGSTPRLSKAGSRGSETSDR